MQESFGSIDFEVVAIAVFNESMEILNNTAKLTMREIFIGIPLQKKQSFKTEDCTNDYSLKNQ